MTEELIRKTYLDFQENNPIGHCSLEAQLMEFGKICATEATKELQEEANEWKTRFENLQKYLDTQNCYQECAETWLKLTEAKKIIREYSDLEKFPSASGNSINMFMYENIKKKAEAFLKE